MSAKLSPIETTRGERMHETSGHARYAKETEGSIRCRCSVKGWRGNCRRAPKNKVVKEKRGLTKSQQEVYNQ